MLETQEIQTKNNIRDAVEKVTGQKKGKNVVSKQAATEMEHVVVRGLDQGKTIVRTVVMVSDNDMETEGMYD